MATGTDFVRRVRNLLWAGALLGVAAASLVLLIIAIVGIALIPVGIGGLLLFAALAAARPVAGAARHFACRQLDRPYASPYRPLPPGRSRLVGMLREPSSWRDLLWLLVNGTAGLALAIVALVEAVLNLVLNLLPPGLALLVIAHLDHALLVPGEKERLESRVQQLAESRAQTVDASAAELRRIERDLHDGAQARLVALALNLGMAQESLDGPDPDPSTARELIAQAREASSTALAELRDLVRGIHPPVLADRGLGGAVQALALAAPLPVQVSDELPGRLAAPVESAVYFAVAEALTNVAKHSGASRADVVLAHADGVLTATVTDDGCGGADPSGGTGLRGITERLGAFDGTLEVQSPHGGPTVLTILLPVDPLPAPSA